jgi:hypothetical protein
MAFQDVRPTDAEGQEMLVAVLAEISAEETGGDVKSYGFSECGTDPMAEGYDTGDYEVLELCECAFGECYVEVYHPYQDSEWCDYSLTFDYECGACGPDSVEDDTCEDAA